MYGSVHSKPSYLHEVNTFLLATEKHSMETKKATEILCPCSDCKNHLTWSDVTIIRSHLIMRGFVKDYTIWIHHGETTIKVVEPGEENMEDIHTYIDAFIDELENLNIYRLSPL